jgi:hypothetical protein
MVHAQFLGSMLKISHRNHPIEIMNLMSGANVCKARNSLVSHFLATDSEYLLMVDSDMVFREDCVDRLVEHELPIVNGMYMQPNPDSSLYPCMYRHTVGTDRDQGMFTTVGGDFPRGELIRVDAVGAGFMMVRRDVFEAIAAKIANPAAPWFQEEQRGPALCGEDFVFCMRAAECGYDILVDTSVSAGHVKPMMLGEVR